jgi:hypothetical protein
VNSDDEKNYDVALGMVIKPVKQVLKLNIPDDNT